MQNKLPQQYRFSQNKTNSRMGSIRTNLDTSGRVKSKNKDTNNSIDISKRGIAQQQKLINDVHINNKCRQVHQQPPLSSIYSQQNFINSQYAVNLQIRIRQIVQIFINKSKHEQMSHILQSAIQQLLLSILKIADSVHPLSLINGIHTNNMRNDQYADNQDKITRDSFEYKTCTQSNHLFVHPAHQMIKAILENQDNLCWKHKDIYESNTRKQLQILKQCSAEQETSYQQIQQSQYNSKKTTNKNTSQLRFWKNRESNKIIKINDGNSSNESSFISNKGGSVDESENNCSNRLIQKLIMRQNYESTTNFNGSSTKIQNCCAASKLNQLYNLIKIQLQDGNTHAAPISSQSCDSSLAYPEIVEDSMEIACDQFESESERSVQQEVGIFQEPSSSSLNSLLQYNHTRLECRNVLDGIPFYQKQSHKKGLQQKVRIKNEINQNNHYGDGNKKTNKAQRNPIKQINNEQRLNNGSCRKQGIENNLQNQLNHEVKRYRELEHKSQRSNDHESIQDRISYYYVDNSPISSRSKCLQCLTIVSGGQKCQNEHHKCIKKKQEAKMHISKVDNKNPNYVSSVYQKQKQNNWSTNVIDTSIYKCQDYGNHMGMGCKNNRNNANHGNKADTKLINNLSSSDAFVSNDYAYSQVISRKKIF